MLLPEGLVLATHNPGKLDEWRALLGPLTSSADLDVPEPQETGLTFEDNAVLKARATVEATGRPALSEDAGLVLPSGFPGVSTGRFMAERGGWGPGMAELLDEHGLTRAEYVCALALVATDGSTRTVVAAAQGHIGAKVGEGPGVSPWFFPVGQSQSWAALGSTWRQRHDHRALAIAAFWPHFWTAYEARTPHIR